MAELLETSAPLFTQLQAPTLARHCARKQELDVLASGSSPVGHKHTLDDITDFEEALLDVFENVFADSTTVRWAPNTIACWIPEVICKPAGGVIATEGGLAIDSDLFTGVGHTHEQLHEPLVLDEDVQGLTGSIGGSLNAQVLSLWVRTAEAGGLIVEGSGLVVDWNRVAAKDHTHANDHPALAVSSTPSVDLGVTGGQVLSGTVRLDPGTSTGRGRIGSSASGLFVELGTSANTAAAGDHPHANATVDAPGFMSAEDKRKLESYADVLQVDQSIGFHRHDELKQGEYVGGRHRWGQAMQLMFVHLTAAPGSAEAVLGLEVDGVVVEQISIPAGVLAGVPAGPACSEVDNFKGLVNVFVPPDAFLRVLCLSGVGVPEEEPARIDVSLVVRPAVASVPSVRINAGGAGASSTGLSAPLFSADQYGTGGAAVISSTGCDTSAVLNPAPQAVYLSARRQTTNENITYEVTRLARGIEYLVRLHFNQFAFSGINDEVFHVCVAGATTFLTQNVDIVEEAGGANRALIKEYVLAADNAGQIQVQLQPQQGNGGRWGASICGLEFLPQVD